MLVLPSPEPVTIRFLKATVGFFKDDCATQLGSNSAGVRFLALASALLNSLDLVEATKAVHAMILETAADAMLVPTFTHVHALMKSIEGRCQRSGFANDVVGYAILIARTLRPAISEDLMYSYGYKPTSSMISQLVEAFRQLGRIGNPEIVGLTIVAKKEASWIVAFTKWCIGLPPTVYLGDSPEGRILDQPRSPVTVRVPTGDFDGITIRTEYNFAAPTELIVSREKPSPRLNAIFQGMISVEAFGDISLAKLQRTIHVVDLDALLGEIWDLMLYTLRVFRNLDFLHNKLRKMQKNGWTVRSFDHLSNEQDIAESYAKLFGLKEPLGFRTYGNEAAFRLGPELSKYLLQAKCCICICGCVSPHTCLCKEVLTDDITEIMVKTICVSILKPHSDLRLYFSPNHDLDCNVIHDDITTVICGLWRQDDVNDIKIRFERTPILFGNVKSLSYELLGCDFTAYELEEAIMFSHHGQVVYPLIYELSLIPVRGYSNVGVIPGSLRLQGSDVSLVVGIDEPRLGSVESIESEYGLTTIKSATAHSPPPVSSLINYFPGVEVCWMVEQLGEGTVSAAISVRRGTRGLSSCRANPSEGICSLKSAISLESCPHDPRSSLLEIDGNAVLGGIVPPPTSEMFALSSPGFVTVIPIAGAEDLRFFALSSRHLRVVLRGRACLACCLKLCREVKAPLLLL